ncbi:GPI ethanolamine phosphate transferase [Thraustotheca clavata]|uniref:GPI ethanolamine phosphate transferase n=1 Tax=Thraustotheca clavata TaxID=74557 RepID=A0A1W0A6G4_9STRA|nr:GPI ethanolamine phosphate transferase [Thraustotheca clavata]
MSRRTLCVLLALHAAGLFLFTSGFFLTRYEVKDASACVPPSPASSFRRAPQRGCWYEQKFDRVVYVVIDALRYDFMHPATIEEEREKDALGGRFFLNHLPYVHQILASEPANSLLYRFVADAPTMTMQRLKGLTTGTLPTFLDIKDNMQSTEIVEDSWVQQLILLNKSIVFMGDNTWDSLYGGKFLRNYSYDSFNVKDLHTVDNGVLAHIYPELEQSDWDVLIAHFLGVDHVGHTYGPNSPFMESKLDQMNDFLKSIIERVDTGSLLVVLGDHGMSDDGNHGGATDDETGAALFLYSKTMLHHTLGTEKSTVSYFNHIIGHTKSNEFSVAQVDLVPTLSLLLGLPIPFGNLGAVIPHLFFTSPTMDLNECFERLNAAMRVNVDQIRHYFLSTSTIRMDLPAMLALEDTYAALNNPNLNPRAIYDLLHTYLTEALSLNRSMYTQFDFVNMIWGITLLLLSTLLCVLHCVFDFKDFSISMTVVSALSCGILGFLWPWSLVPHTIVPSAPLPRAVLCMGFGLFYTISKNLSLMQRKQHLAFSRTNILMLLIGLLHCLSLFSNSYLIIQDKVLTFLIASCLVVFGLDVVQNDRDKMINFLLFCLLHRVSSILQRPNIVYSTLSIVQTLLPTIALAYNSSKKHWRYPILWFLVLLYWFESFPMLSLWLPRFVFLVGAISVFENSYIESMTIIFTLLLGPTSPLTLALFHNQFHLFKSFNHQLCGSLLLYLYYFATGHHNGFSSLQNAAAFVGFTDFEFYRAGFLLFLNTFGSFLVGIPLLKCDTNITLSFFSLTCVCTTIFVACQRRHLMVWAIFAPKYIFDGLTLLVVNGLLLLL